MSLQLKTLPLFGESAGATFSPCRRYRYTLWRKWSDAPACQWVGLNPSTADETTLDNTMRRIIAYSKVWGFGGIVMTNLFAWRETDSKKLRGYVTHDIVEHAPGENDRAIELTSGLAARVVCAWGNHRLVPSRAPAVRALLVKHPDCGHLRLLKNGQPEHPLYQPASMPFVRWS